MNKKNFVLILILILLVSLSFIITFFKGDKKRITQVKEDVLEYLSNKYNEEFEIKDYTLDQVPYEIDVVSDEGFETSELYVFKVVSRRLVEFDVVYIEYLDEDVYLNNKANDIMEPGIYDNYLYFYKLKDIKSDIRKDVEDILGNVKGIDVSLTDIGNYYIENLLIRQTLDSKEELVLYDKYLKLDKSVSNIEFYNLTKDITNGEIVVDIEVNDYIDKDNLSEFKKKVKKLVSYLQDVGYVNYEINFKLNKYQSANVTKYFDDDKEQIYLMFDYENFSIEEDMLNVYILDK